MLSRLFSASCNNRSLFRVTIVTLIVTIVALTYVILYAGGMVPPRYTNMSDEAAFAQTDRLYAAHAHACEQAGGTWYAGFADAGCNTMYVAPDTSWYVTPVDNPWYGVTEIVFPVLAAIGISGFVALLVLVPDLWDSTREALDAETKVGVVL